MDDRQFWILVRAAKIRQAKLLEQERSCLLEEVAAIERRWNIEPKERVRQVVVAESDSIATAVVERV